MGAIRRLCTTPRDVLLFTALSLEDRLYQFGAEIESNTIEVYASVGYARNWAEMSLLLSETWAIVWRLMSTNASLKVKLSIGLTLGGLITLAIFGARIPGLVVQKEMNESFDKALKKSAQHILPLVIADSFKQKNNDSLGIPTLENDDEYLTYVVKDQQGNVLLRSKDANQRYLASRPNNRFL